jgi:hypothetical protein
VDASLFSPYSSSDHRYLIAKAYITFYNENPRQRIRGILIDVDSGWTFSINPERLDYFVQTGDRTYLPQPPNLDPKVPEKPYADSGLTANVSPNFNITRWPDGRILNHGTLRPDLRHKRKSGYTLILRSGPGSRFESIREIPRDGTGLIAFDQDRVSRLYRAKCHRLDHCLPIRFTAKLEPGAPATRLRSTSAGQSLAVSCPSASSIARLSTTPSPPFSGISTSAAIF